MQGCERADRQLLDAAALAGHLVPEGSMFAFLAAHRAEVFPDADYADLFAPPGVGRPSLPATQMAAVLTLQALHDYSDRETAEAVRFDVRWKVAIGSALDDGGFDPSSLVYWRNRIAKSGRPHRVNDAVRKVIEQTGVLKGRRRRAVDSTILADAVSTQDTVTQLVSAIRRVAREVPGAAGQITAVCAGHDYSRPGKPKIDWDDPAAKEALVSALVNDANAVVAAFAGAELEEPAACALALLALVAGQDVEPAEGSDGTDGRWRIARKVAGDRVVPAVDPDARHTRKSPEARRDGYRAHLAADPETGIITAEKLTRAAGQDNADPAVIKPKPLQPAVEGGFTAGDFTVSEQDGTVTCPAGVTRPVTPNRNVIFGAACRYCPLRERCTTSRTGRTLTLHEHDGLLRQARARWAAGTGLREDYMKHRPNVERAVSQVATWRVRRLKLRYRGVTRNQAWLKRRTAALNLRNLAGRGLARQHGAWVLVT